MVLDLILLAVRKAMIQVLSLNKKAFRINSF